MSNTDDPPILPIYLVVDVSWSMTDTTNGESPLDVANQILPEILDAMAAHPTVRDRLHVSLIDFSGEAEVRLPMVSGVDLINATDLPTLTPRPTGTSYSAAFLTLRQQIESDAVTLKSGNRDVNRPAVFFITDGGSTDDDGQAESAWSILTAEDFSARPNVIPFGVGEAISDDLDKFARWPRNIADLDRPGATVEPHAFIVTDVSPAKAISKVIDLLIQSVVASIAAGQSSPVAHVVQMAQSTVGSGSIDDDDDDII